MSDMSRDTIPTPVTDLSGLIPSAYMTEKGRAGALMRIEATLGRKPGTFGEDDPGAGLAASHERFKGKTEERFKEQARLLGRMPGTNGFDDEGEGIARHVFDQRVLAKHGQRMGKGSLVAAAAAFLVAATAMIQSYTSTHYPAAAPERNAAAAEAPPRPASTR